MKILVNKKQYALIQESVINERFETMEAYDSIENYVDAFGRVVDELGLCTLNEDEMLSEGILDTLSKALKKGVMIASAAVALGILSPQEAQAQIGSAPDNKIVNIFKDKASKQCKQVGKQKKTQADRSKPTSGVKVFQVKQTDPKFRSADSGPVGSKFFVKNKAGDYKEISSQQLEKLKKRKNISVRQLKGDDARIAIQSNL